jgi:hypothetical protein
MSLARQVAGAGDALDAARTEAAAARARAAAAEAARERADAARATAEAAMQEADQALQVALSPARSGSPQGLSVTLRVYSAAINVCEPSEVQGVHPPCCELARVFPRLSPRQQVPALSSKG